MEPVIRVGLSTGAAEVLISLSGGYRTAGGDLGADTTFSAAAANGRVLVEGLDLTEAPRVTFSPLDFDRCKFTVHDVTIGIDFHWQRREAQQFQGTLALIAGPDGMTVVNEIPLEAYLVSVISSEMSASSPPAALSAHAVVSRSWLLAQLDQSKGTLSPDASEGDVARSGDSSPVMERIRWYGRESHLDFDVCADDHCQRYQGISKAFTSSAFDAVGSTRGTVLAWDGEVCDTRYSKSCGGMTEEYRTAWEDKEIRYLSPVHDGPGAPAYYALPLSAGRNAEAWITNWPPSYCGSASPELLARILPGFDQETRDFYRWQVEYSQAELAAIVEARVGIEIGRIAALEPIERGASGRIIRLRIIGERQSLILGKELEIRRALSRSHLYSSAFVVRASESATAGFPDSFRLLGAGWGHGVGLCQIGAAVMADQGRDHVAILTHYFSGAEVSALY